MMLKNLVLLVLGLATFPFVSCGRQVGSDSLGSTLVTLKHWDHFMHHPKGQIGLGKEDFLRKSSEVGHGEQIEAMRKYTEK